ERGLPVWACPGWLSRRVRSPPTRLCCRGARCHQLDYGLRLAARGAVRRAPLHSTAYRGPQSIRLPRVIAASTVVASAAYRHVLVQLCLQRIPDQLCAIHERAIWLGTAAGRHRPDHSVEHEYRDSNAGCAVSEHVVAGYEHPGAGNRRQLAGLPGDRVRAGSPNSLHCLSPTTGYRQRTVAPVTLESDHQAGVWQRAGAGKWWFASELRPGNHHRPDGCWRVVRASWHHRAVSRRGWTVRPGSADDRPGGTDPVWTASVPN